MRNVTIGHPLDSNTLVGPLIDEGSKKDFLNAIEEVKKEGGKIIYGGEVMSGEGFESGCYVRPCIAEVENHYNIVQEETFAPILYLIKCSSLEDAMEKHNDVPQGLSSAIFSNNLRETEKILISCRI